LDGYSGGRCAASSPKSLPTPNRHTPRRRGIQYAAAYRLYRRRLWNTGSSAPVRNCARRTMTANTPSPSRGAFRPGFANRFAQTRGRRECRVLAAPAVSCVRDGGRGAHEHTGTAGALRHSPRNGFTAYAELSPETNSFCLRHRRIDGVGKPGRASYASADLTPATGARTTRFCRTLQCRSSAAPPVRSRAEARPAIPSAQRALPRPPHSDPRP
jgi:hypothetical protein